MCLYLLNGSVDSPDMNPDYIPEDLSCNDQESIIELILEKVLGFDNMMVEYDDCDTEQEANSNNNQLTDNLFIPILITLTKHIIFSKNTRAPTVSDKHIVKTYSEIHSPPPEH
jgi:hypothetical protein